MRIPVPDSINPGGFQGDRLSTASPDMAAPARALQGLGRAVSGLGADWQANKDKMDSYNAALSQERWSTDVAVNYNKNFESSAPDGSDFVGKHEDYLLKSYEATLKGIKNPEDQQRFTMLFERTRGNHLVKGMDDARRKGESYVKATTGDSISEAIKSGSITSEAEYNDYLENVVKPRISQYISDPLEQKATWQVFAGQMRQEFIRSNPQVAMPKAKGGGDAASKSAALLRQFEGFRETPYWDVNAYRLGYGSDTVTKADGSVVRVQQGMNVSRDDAERDLARRAAEFQKAAAKDVGAAWGNLSADAQAALTSVAYNYGSLPGGVVKAAQTGNAGAIADAVESLKGHNGGVNAKRRMAEAAIIRGSAAAPSGGPVTYELPSPPSGGIWEGMDVQEWDSYSKEGVKALKGMFDLGIVQGTVARDDILAAPLSDTDKAYFLRKWDSENKDTQALAGFTQRLSSGEFINPKSSDDRKGAAKLLDAAGGAEAIANGDPQAVAGMFELYRKAGIVPDNAKGAIESMLRSKDTSRVTTALSYLKAMREENFRTFQQEFDEKTEALVLDYAKGLDYETPQQAAEKVTEAISPEKEAVRKERRKEAGKVADGITVNDAQEYFDPSYLPFTQPEMSIAPDAEAELMADYRNLFVRAYETTGDETKAKKIAADQLTRVWGVSQANGGRIMKWPPEVLYGPNAMVNGSYDWMAEAVKRGLDFRGYTRATSSPVYDAMGNVVSSEPGTEPLPYYLLADAQTKAEHAQGKSPTYQVWVVNDDGTFDVVPSRFSFDVSEAKKAYRAQVEREQRKNLQNQQRIDQMQEGGEFDLPPAFNEGLGP